ncbi:hypothetical protein [Paracoccus denitrificans]|uniref:hypothetical protein n=1 Tax=Paracoccus denitrificans TaxID=266 RepID=UPI0005A09D4A|nr:hypothetical protein [Paracoccus denitrificans]MBB4629955.1 hypothetical protein [Paracoccus denitrificans]MCU7431316.1 hypothetical protein [Paracoccus denitrificans]UPV97677.1 hypothetical protein M0K93_16610 [Paracoccus denitrificans]WQO35591.1 hypothetical protein U0005_22495 [Paracoccus denitrificans]SDJ76421.1 extracellular solute-binding protein, family 7 [Paracoccus denitrificans]
MKSTTMVATAALCLVAPLAGAGALTFAHGFQPAHIVCAHGLDPWMACVAERGGGEIEFNHFPGDQISSHQGAVDALNSGLTQIFGVILSYVSEEMPNGISLLPDMGRSSAELVATYRKALETDGRLIQEYHANQLQPIFLNLLPPYKFLSGVGPVDTIEKFANLKASIGGGSQMMMAQAMGAGPVYITAADLYVSMRRKTVDGTFLTLASAKPHSLTAVMNAVSANGSFGSGELSRRRCAGRSAGHFDARLPGAQSGGAGRAGQHPARADPVRFGCGALLCQCGQCAAPQTLRGDGQHHRHPRLLQPDAGGGGWNRPADPSPRPENPPPRPLAGGQRGGPDLPPHPEPIDPVELARFDDF